MSRTQRPALRHPIQRPPRTRHAISRRFAALVAAVACTVGASAFSGAVAADEPTAQLPAAELPATSTLRASESLGYTALNPERILDTRRGIGALTGRLDSNTTLQLRVLGTAGVPISDVDSVVLNVTAVNPTADRSFLTVWPGQTNQPPTSNLNYVRGQTVPNLVIVKVGSNGRVDISNAVGEVHVLADIVGYYADTSDFTGLAPDRLLDTRLGVGAPQERVGAGRSIDLQVTGRGGVPADGVGSVVLNLTALQGTQGSFITAWPTGIARPNASNVNFDARSNVPNLAIVKVGAGGKVSLYNEAGQVNLLADVVGYFIDGASYVGVTPERILDTRTGVGAPTGKVGASGEIAVDVLGVAGVPAADVRAVVLNMTAASPEAASFLTVWPSGDDRPTASSLNMAPFKSVANLVIAKVGLDGKVAIYNDRGRTHVIADVVGYVDASAGVDLPAFDLPVENDWSAITWTVNRFDLREQDGTSGSFQTNRADTPFVLDVRIRAQNNSVDQQVFRYSSIQLDLGSGDPVDVISTDPSLQFRLGGGGLEDIDVAFPIGWTDDLSNARIRFGGEFYEIGFVDLGGAQPPSVVSAPVGFLPAGTSVDGLCNGSGTMDFSTRSATWTTVLPNDVDTTGDDRAARQARSGTRWLVLEIDVVSNCSFSNLVGSEFRLDVDTGFVSSSSFINELISNGEAQTIVAAYKVPVDATTVELVIDGAPPFAIPTTNLG